MKNFPRIDDKQKIKNFNCDKCKKESLDGFKIEWRYTWFVGDNEFEKLCTNCYQLLPKKLKK